MKKLLALALTVAMVLTCVSFAAVAETAAGGEPIKITLYYSDNATLPFQEDWLAVKTIEEKFNVDFTFEVIPIADYATKVSLALNTGTNTPDVILYQTTKGENGSLALNGALVPVSDYSDWTPNFNARVEEFGLTDAVNSLKLSDGKLYYLPSLTDIPFYDGGLILREDYLTSKGLSAPKTFDDLYAILKAYKADYPDSYPLTILAGPRVLYRMTMPSWGISLGKNSSSGSNTLSWDYTNKTYFAGATSDQYKAYITFFAKLYAEGLLDPEMADPIDGDMWSQKMATGASMATYAYYDQIGGVTAASEIEGFKLNMYPALEGPAGAHHQPKSSTGNGIMFPIATSKRADFEQVVKTIDAAFFSEEAAKIWCLGVDGVTYTEKDGQITYSDELVNAPDGVYKTLQVKYGCGSDVTQMVWYNAREMTKYDENYAAINATVRDMGDVIQPIPPSPMFDDLTAEDAGLLQTPLNDAWEIWNDAFLTGKKSIDTDWDAYVAEMQTKGIDDFCKLYNDNMAK
ncbi:MAG TPA: extracellular solute-binding protein [Candidatus Limiplasma sp.]|nr:extracellular solute-binding protein [Candidatus Limiplasma sp.]HPS81440.1 extracellular solute-binding protein [Candidatus Limiplasma sp.]